MSKNDFIKPVIARAVVVCAFTCGGQTPQITGPDAMGQCWVEVPRTIKDLSWAERQARELACKQNSNTCDLPLGTKKVPAACPPVNPAPPTPVPAVTATEVCPVGMQLGTDETGKYLCSDGVHTSEPKKFTPLAPSTPAPVAR